MKDIITKAVICFSICCCASRSEINSPCDKLRIQITVDQEKLFRRSFFIVHITIENNAQNDFFIMKNFLGENSIRLSDSNGKRLERRVGMISDYSPEVNFQDIKKLSPGEFYSKDIIGRVNYNDKESSYFLSFYNFDHLVSTDEVRIRARYKIPESTRCEVKECFGIELYSGELVSSDLTYYFDGHSFARIGKVKEKKEKGREGVKKGVKEGVIKEGVSPIN